jgi:hypothetical protein
VQDCSENCNGSLGSHLMSLKHCDVALQIHQHGSLQGRDDLQESSSRQQHTERDIPLHPDPSHQGERVFGNLPDLHHHRKDLQQGQEVQADLGHTERNTEDAGVITGAGVGVVGVTISVFAYITSIGELQGMYVHAAFCTLDCAE